VGSACRSAAILVALGKCNPWLWTSVCVDIIVFDQPVCVSLCRLYILFLHPHCWGSILRRSNVTAAVAVCCLPRRFSLFIYVTVDVTAGVSGFEGREVVFEVIWQCNI
jgi:hypothetical protein